MLLYDLRKLTVYWRACTIICCLSAIDGIGSSGVDFSIVCRHYLGRWAEIVSVIFSVISLIGAAMVYWILMSNFLFHTVSFIYGWYFCVDSYLVKSTFTQDVLKKKMWCI